MINIDILKKLIELACNNPNENEANSAARKVCRMLKEDRYQAFNGAPISQPKPKDKYTQGPPHRPGGFNWDYDINKEDIRRAAEEAARRQEEYRRADEERRRKRQEEEYKEQVKKEQEKQKYRSTTYKKEGITLLECTLCHETKPTLYSGPPELFVCTRCKIHRHKGGI